jgi:hypothetical protein
MTVKIVKIFNESNPNITITVDDIANNIKMYKSKFQQQITELKKNRVKKSEISQKKVPTFNYKEPQRDEN